MAADNKVLGEFSEALRQLFNPDLSNIYELVEKHPIKDEKKVYTWNIKGKQIKGKE
jgi:hypothetical protein